MLGGRGRLSQGSCTHPKTMVITTGGIERVVCESCANVSFMFLDNMKDDIDRHAFARNVDEPRAEEMADATT